jgi:hypothetical protein
MAFTETAVARNNKLRSVEGKRTWDVWDAPPPSLEGVITALHLVFPTSELAVRPEQRSPKIWNGVIYIPAAPPGQMVLVTLYVTVGDLILAPGGATSLRLASLVVDKARYAQLVAYGAPEGDMPALIERSTRIARKQAQSKQVTLPPETYVYFFGHRDDGARFLVGARVFR